jgi:hypothetical protein
MAKRSKTVRRGRGQRGGLEGVRMAQDGGLNLVGVGIDQGGGFRLTADGGTRRYGRTKRRGSRRGRGQRGGGYNVFAVDGGTRRYGRTKRRGSRRGRGQRGGDEYDLKAKQFLAGLPMDERPSFAQQYTVLKRELGSSEVAFNKMMSHRSAPTNIDYEDDARVKQFIRGLPTTEKPAFASKYTELKKTMGSERAFNTMMSLLQGNANDTNLMEHYGVSLDDKPPVSANVPYSSNDSSLSSLYQHYSV